MAAERYTRAELESLPTLAVGQADNLKIDDGSTRVWLCRCGIADGMALDALVTVERLTESGWVTVDEYGAV